MALLISTFFSWLYKNWNKSKGVTGEPIAGVGIFQDRITFALPSLTGGAAMIIRIEFTYVVIFFVFVVCVIIYVGAELVGLSVSLLLQGVALSELSGFFQSQDFVKLLKKLNQDQNVIAEALEAHAIGG